jgi:hypothetical protein
MIQVGTKNLSTRPNNSIADSTVCQIGSNQLWMRSINNGLIWQEMFTKPSARKG